jgi:hypothetical protein
LVVARGEATFPTKTLSTKVSEDQLAQLEAAASERRLNLSGWCRETLLARANGEPARASDPGVVVHAVIAELSALRAILLNVLFGVANRETLNVEEMQQQIVRASRDLKLTEIEKIASLYDFPSSWRDRPPWLPVLGVRQIPGLLC